MEKGKSRMNEEAQRERLRLITKWKKKRLWRKKVAKRLKNQRFFSNRLNRKWNGVNWTEKNSFRSNCQLCVLFFFSFKTHLILSFSAKIMNHFPALNFNLFLIRFDFVNVFFPLNWSESKHATKLVEPKMLVFFLEELSLCRELQSKSIQGGFFVLNGNKLERLILSSLISSHVLNRFFSLLELFFFRLFLLHLDGIMRWSWAIGAVFHIRANSKLNSILYCHSFLIIFVSFSSCPSDFNCSRKANNKRDCCCFLVIGHHHLLLFVSNSLCGLCACQLVLIYRIKRQVLRISNGMIARPTSIWWKIWLIRAHFWNCFTLEINDFWSWCRIGVEESRDSF